MKSKKFFGVLLMMVFLLLALMCTAVIAAGLPEDIKDHWAEEEISSWVLNGLVKGYEDGSFKPNNAVTRAEYITLVNRAFGFNTKAQISFSDVPTDAWYYDEIAKAAAVGYIKGYEDSTMKPNNKISRQEAAVVLSRLLKLKDTGEGSKLSRFSDSASIPVWAKSEINVVVSDKYMGGYPDGAYRPANPITRAETVKVLSRAVGKLYNTSGVYGTDKIK
ncbi:MAG: S-layer homology domain-containing protein [Bacillota bacterium]